MGKRFNFGAVVGAYMLAGLVVACAIHLIALGSPRYRWIAPPRAAGAPAPSAAQVK
jgi:hypothetical protein